MRRPYRFTDNRATRDSPQFPRAPAVVRHVAGVYQMCPLPVACLHDCLHSFRRRQRVWLVLVLIALPSCATYRTPNVRHETVGRGALE
jgi:hypothetical protein